MRIVRAALAALCFVLLGSTTSWAVGGFLSACSLINTSFSGPFSNTFPIAAGEKFYVTSNGAGVGSGSTVGGLPVSFLPFTYSPVVDEFVAVNLVATGSGTLQVSCGPAGSLPPSGTPTFSDDFNALVMASMASLSHIKFSSNINVGSIVGQIGKGLATGAGAGTPTPFAPAGRPPATTVFDAVFASPDKHTELNQIHFSGSLSALAYAGGEPGGDLAQPGVGSPFDIWFDASASGLSRSDASALTGTMGAVRVGAQYKITDHTLVGAMAGYDYSQFKTGYNGGSVNIHAATLAPYVGIRLNEYLVFSLAGGAVFTNLAINTGSDTGSTTGLRGFVMADLTGTWQHGPWRFAPSTTFHYASEQQQAYTTAGGTPVAAQTINAGRFSGGLTVGYRLPAESGWNPELFGSFSLFNDFTGISPLALSNGGTYSPDTFGGSVGGGLNFGRGNFSGAVGASYDSLFRPEQSWRVYFNAALHY